MLALFALSFISTLASLINLNGDDWKLIAAASSAAAMNATVPGGVWDNLQRNGVIGDLHYRDNDVRFMNATHPPGGWRFTKSFTIPASTSTEEALLEFQGLQGVANISLNGYWLLATDNMFRTYRVAVPSGLLRQAGAANTLAIHLDAAPPPMPYNGAAPETVRTRTEADQWGWDWSPNLNPIAIIGFVRLITTTAAAPHLVSFSPSVSVTAFDAATAKPSAFAVNASVEVVVHPNQLPNEKALRGTLTLRGDWGLSSTTDIELSPAAAATTGGPPPDHAHAPYTATFHATLRARVPDVKLWWPLHYGEANLHTVRAELRWGAGASVIAMEKQLGFRSVALFTGSTTPPVPARADPALKAAYVGCFRDGNPYWGCAPTFSDTCQHALPILAANDATGMTVAKCVKLCASQGEGRERPGAVGGFPLAGLQDRTKCYCGTAIGAHTPGSMPGVGTATDASVCGSACSGDPAVACGGSSYMWGSNSVYNVSAAMRLIEAAALEERSPRPPPPTAAVAAAEGSGDSAFALVINGVKVFSRGANLVPFELLEATVNTTYINRTLQSTVDGGMNMLRVWGGGMYQIDAFYEECDRLGIMLYHDVMFCQPLYPHDDAFVHNVKAELKEQIARLRTHASIVLWDGSNENEGDPAFFYATVLTEIAQNDPERPLWPASPSSGFDQGVHTATGLPNGNTLVGRFAGKDLTLDTHMPYNFCTRDFVTSSSLDQTTSAGHDGDGRATFFKSEFGQVGLPAWETISPVLNGSLGDMGIHSKIIQHRKHANDLVKGLVSLFGLSAATQADTSEANFKRMIYLSQLSQSLCIKTFFEELRRGNNTFGGLIWMLNDVWQASSWGSLDYGGRWRPLHHSFQAVLAPTIVSVWVDGTTLRVFGSHQGAKHTGTSASTKVEINVTDVATGATTAHFVVDGIDHKGSAVIEELMSLPMNKVNTAKEVITTRLLSAATGDVTTGDASFASTPIPLSETIHPLLDVQGSSNLVNGIAWRNVLAAEVTPAVSSSTAASAVVTIRNAAASPVFYAVVTSTYAGRFSRNLMQIPAKGAVVVEFLFAKGQGNVDTDATVFEKSLRVEWFNKE